MSLKNITTIIDSICDQVYIKDFKLEELDKQIDQLVDNIVDDSDISNTKDKCCSGCLNNGNITTNSNNQFINNTNLFSTDAFNFASDLKLFNNNKKLF